MKDISPKKKGTREITDFHRNIARMRMAFSIGHAMYFSACAIEIFEQNTRTLISVYAL